MADCHPDRKHRGLGLCGYCYKKHKAAGYKERRRAMIYGLTPDQVQDLFRRHQGLCWICQNKTAQGIDHDHNTGVVRGALCNNCNLVLGHCADNTAILEAAIKYLNN